MKLLLLGYYCIIMNCLVKAQIPAIQWQKCYGGTGNDLGTSIQQTIDGGYIVAGTSRSINGDVTVNYGNSDNWVVKLDPNNVIIWQKTFGGSTTEFKPTIRATSDGGYILATSTLSSNSGNISMTNHGAADTWIVKLDVNGNITWQNLIGGLNNDQLFDIQQTSDGGYIIAVLSESNDGDVSGNHGNGDYWVVKLTSTGSISWQKCYGGSQGESPTAIKQTLDGGYIVTGSSTSTDGDVTNGSVLATTWTIRLDNTGNIIWDKSYGTRVPGSDAFSAIDLLFDGSFILAGQSTGNAGDVTGWHGSFDFWVVKLSGTGSLVWQKSLGGSQEDHATSIKATSDGGSIVVGSTKSNDFDVSGHHNPGSGMDDSWVVKLSSTGAIQWQSCFGGLNTDVPNELIKTNDGGYAIVHQSNTNNNGDVGVNHGSYDYWVLKLASDIVVPIVLTNFNARLVNKAVNCNWRTLQEQNSSHFFVERSIDRITYDNIGRINSIGNSNTPKNYEFNDLEPLSGISYYRLKMVDIDNSYRYSDIKLIKIYESPSIKVFPNPSISTAKFNLINFGSNKLYTLRIVDVIGKQIALHTSTSGILEKKGSDVLSSLNSGVYFIILYEGNSIIASQKIVRQN